MVDAVLGCDIKVKTIYGEEKSLKIPAGSQNGEQIKLSKEGFYRVNTSIKGNHIVTLRIQVPKTLSEEEKNLY